MHKVQYVTQNILASISTCRHVTCNQFDSLIEHAEGSGDSFDRVLHLQPDLWADVEQAVVHDVQETES